jgi:hypothetical protein
MATHSAPAPWATKTRNPTDTPACGRRALKPMGYTIHNELQLQLLETAEVDRGHTQPQAAACSCEMPPEVQQGTRQTHHKSQGAGCVQLVNL